MFGQGKFWAWQLSSLTMLALHNKRQPALSVTHQGHHIQRSGCARFSSTKLPIYDMHQHIESVPCQVCNNDDALSKHVTTPLVWASFMPLWRLCNVKGKTMPCTKGRWRLPQLFMISSIITESSLRIAMILRACEIVNSTTIQSSLALLISFHIYQWDR